MLAKYRILAALFGALVIACGLAPRAAAVVVHTSGGQFLGVAPRPGIAPADVGGAVRASAAATVTAAGPSWLNLNYNGGPVVHSSAPYLIFWDPNGETVPWRSLIGTYFGDVAAGSGSGANVYAVARQFTDRTGFADYQQTFDPQRQIIEDTHSFPQPKPAECASSAYTTCLSDSQLQAELSTLILADGLPTDGATGASALPDDAPIYFLVLPSDVDVCDSDGSCASNVFCAYHSDYADGAANVLYAAIPTIALSDPQGSKSCQWDGNPVVQEPNFSVADVALTYISHEDNETITDPLGTGWWSWYTGYENGDNCNDYETNPGAFAPALGGDAGAGTLYNQLIGTDRYYLQSEWSNGGSNCLMQASGGTISPRFSVPAGPRSAGSALSFEPSASTGTYQFTSETWDFGDGTPPSFHAGRTLTRAAHTYAAAGRYTVTLKLVDNRGELGTVSEPITVGVSPTAAFTASSIQLPEGSGPVSFDAGGSSTNAGSIDSYAWDFGDGATAQGATASHTFVTAGTYLVRLTITDSAGNVDTATKTITVTDEPPVAGFTIAVPNPEAGRAVAFDGSSSSDPDGSITAYVWNFGDGRTGSGVSPSHTYASPGTYPVKLTVTDSSGQRVSLTQQLTVLAGPSVRFSPASPQVQEGTPLGFDASASAGGASGAAIASYTWTFGDGTSGSGARPSHTYGGPGTYTVKLTVTDSAGASASTTLAVTVIDEPAAAAFGTSPAVPIPGQAVTFDGRGSGDPDGAIVSYAWSFGDGSTGTGATPTHSYATAGTYTVGLTVVDRDGQRASASKPVTVYAQPQATFGYSPVLPVEDAATTFTGTAKGSNPVAMISSYVWDFGDGTTAAGATVSHVYAHQGGYRVTLTVTDGFGLTSSVSEVVTVVDAAPVAVISQLTGPAVVRHPIEFGGGRSHDSDDPIVSYLWRFGDGTGGVGKKLTHTFARAGSYRVTLTVRDSFGQTGTATTTVRVTRTGAVSRDRRSSRRRRRKG